MPRCTNSPKLAYGENDVSSLSGKFILQDRYKKGYLMDFKMLARCTKFLVLLQQLLRVLSMSRSLLRTFSRT